MVRRRIALGWAALLVAALTPFAASAQFGRPPAGAYGARGWYGPPPPRFYAPPRRFYGPPPGYESRRFRHCDRGTGGTILGAIAGGLLGNAVAGRGDRGVGTVVGAGAGALAGRAIDRDCR